MKEFIVTTDLDEKSDTNVYTSYHLAKTLGLRPKLYFVDTHPIGPKDYKDILFEKVSQQLERVLLKIEDFDFEIFAGTISEGILNLKTNDEMEIISIGSSDHGEIHRLFFNTFAEKAFFNLKKDVLVVKKKENKFCNICLLLNPLEGHERIVEKTVELLRQLKAKLHIVSIPNLEFLGLNLEAFPVGPTPLEERIHAKRKMYKKTELLLKELESHLKKSGIDIEHTIKVTLNEESSLHLNKILHEMSPDIVIMSPQLHFLNHFSLGSITHYLMKRNDCNFYLIP